MRRRAGLTLRVAAAATVLAVAAAQAGADDYIEALKEKVPYYRVMTGPRAPMYEPLARQMVLEYGLNRGIAVEIGGNAGAFAMALAEQTEMKVYNLDIDVWAIRLCGVLVDQAGLTGRVIPIEGDALDMPLRDDFADFVFSRAVIPFVDDKVQFMRECYRILKPGGVAYVGHGGFGTLLDPEIRQKLVEARLRRWAEQGPPEGWDGPAEGMVELAQQAGIEHYRLITEPDVGWWLEIRKPAAE
ncbi:MAG: class I SAM-dependent methyltransferase [Armatimonadota bacterium]